MQDAETQLTIHETQAQPQVDSAVLELNQPARSATAEVPLNGEKTLAGQVAQVLSPSVQLTIEMRKLSRHELSTAQKLYSANGYVTLVKPIDSVYGAFIDGRLVGVARLSPEYDVFVLKGVVVSESYRHKGIGRRLAQLALDEIKERDCYMAIERDELQFYNSLGFAHIAADRAPDHLRRKLEQNQRKMKEIFLLKRPSQLS